jgi:hypothetical protein
MTDLATKDVVYSDRARGLKVGMYRHYKGHMATVIAVAVHSETLEELVVYHHVNKDGVDMVWVRPIEMFLETVVVDGVKRPRFERLGS